MKIDLVIMLCFGGLALLVILISVKLAMRPRKKQDESDAWESDKFALFKKLTAEHPDNPEPWVAWGNELARSASTAKHSHMRLHRYNEACACFQRAVEISPSLVQAWKNWGQTLYETYRQQDCMDRLILDNAHTRYQTAANLAPEDPSIWQHWAEELHTTAYAVHGEHKRELQALGDARFERAVALNPDLAATWKSGRGGQTSAQGGSDGVADLSAPAGAEAPLPWARGTRAPQEASPWLMQNQEQTGSGHIATVEPDVLFSFAPHGEQEASAPASPPGKGGGEPT